MCPPAIETPRLSSVFHAVTQSSSGPRMLLQVVIVSLLDSHYNYFITTLLQRTQRETSGQIICQLMHDDCISRTTINGCVVGSLPSSRCFHCMLRLRTSSRQVLTVNFNLPVHQFDDHLFLMSDQYNRLCLYCLSLNRLYLATAVSFVVE